MELNNKEMRALKLMIREFAANRTIKIVCEVCNGKANALSKQSDPMSGSEGYYECPICGTKGYQEVLEFPEMTKEVENRPYNIYQHPHSNSVVRSLPKPE